MGWWTDGARHLETKSYTIYGIPRYPMTSRRTRRSSTGLMLVEDPEDTLRTLCRLKDSVITWDSFKAEYEKTKQREREPVDEKTTDTHFYTLGVFDLIGPLASESAHYRITQIGKDVCALLQKGKTQDLEARLRSILLTNEDKGPLFKDFLNFVTKPTSRKAIFQRFREIPARTLIAWTRYAGLVEVEGDMTWRLHLPTQELPTESEFFETLIKTYNEMQKTETPGIRRIFVDINEIRRNVCYKLNGLSVSEFDGYLRRILDSSRGKGIRLYGAPTSVFEEKRNFAYKSRVYAYLSVGV